MKDTFISILAVLALATPPAHTTDLNKDGFNFYKDYLRGRSEEGAGEGPVEDRMLYFYRTPVSAYPGLLPTLDQEYRKRTGNAYKNHMLSKEMLNGEVPRKRGSKTALSFLMGGKQPFIASDEPAGDVYEIPLKVD